MKEIFSYTKLFTLLITIFFIFGLIGSFYNCEILFSFIVFVLLSLILLVFKYDLAKLLILYLIFFIGLTRAHYSMDLSSTLDEFYSNNAKIEGYIVSSSDISVKNDRIKFYFLAKDAKIENKNFNNLNTKFLVSIDGIGKYKDKISIGNYVRIKGKLRHPMSPSNPYQFDYRKYLLNNDVKNILYADDFEKLKEPRFSGNLDEKWYYILNKFEKTRNKILIRHSKNIKSPNLEILGGIVFGNETINPDDTVKENFKNSGLLHLLAASGLNVALIYGIWWWLASLVRFPYNLSIFLGAGFVVLYTFMTGFPPSILRASIMLLFVLVGKIINRNADSLALVFFVGFLMLLFNPKMLFDVGFQLSFVVTIGLVALCPVIVSKFEKYDKRFKEKYKNSSRISKYFIFLFSPSSLASIICVPLIAQLCVIPLQIHYFNNFIPLSVLANIAVVPFVGILSFIGFVSSIIALVPILCEPLTYIFDIIANPMLNLLVKISEFFASFKFSLISTMGFNIFQIFMFWLLLGLFVILIKYNFKNKKIIYTTCVCLVIFLFSFLKFDYFKNNLEIIMFDVGNADSFLIKTPKNKFIMIDTGRKTYRSVTSAQIVINKYLRNERINKLEKLIVTHFDSDHCGGVLDIVQSTKVNEIFLQSDNAKSQTSKEIFDYLNKNHLNYKIAKNNQEIYREKDIKIKIFKANLSDENESSIVTLLTYKDKNILFMGDCGIKGYENIKKYLPNNIEILKVGHHGAKFSIDDKMIKNIKPSYALISAGFNMFNHPHYQTIEILNNNNVKIISTKNLGFSKIVIKDDSNKFYYFNTVEKRIKKIKFDSDLKEKFHKNKYTQNLIKNNT